MWLPQGRTQPLRTDNRPEERRGLGRRLRWWSLPRGRHAGGLASASGREGRGECALPTVDAARAQELYWQPCRLSDRRTEAISGHATVTTFNHPAKASHGPTEASRHPADAQHAPARYRRDAACEGRGGIPGKRS